MRICDLCKKEARDLYTLNPSYIYKKNKNKLSEICIVCLDEINSYDALVTEFLMDKKDGWVKRFIEKFSVKKHREG